MNIASRRRNVRYRRRLGSDFVSARRRRYYEREKASGKHQERSREWRAANHAKARQMEMTSQRKRLATPMGKLENRVRSAIHHALKRRDQCGYLRHLSYTIADLAEHLESLFVDGMSWENIGDWHIDHIKPVSSFYFESIDDPEFLECWSLENLQPLWAADNLRKGAAVAA